MLAAPASGSGKTMLTCGILQAFVNRKLAPASFKCGPDYIDPMFHSKVIGAKSRNLDPFFTDRETTRYLFARTARDAGVSVLEGVMGIFDGLGGVSVQASSYDLACVTDTPVILIVNARGMSLSVIPMIQGYLDYQKRLGREVIRGVILNQTTKMTYLMLKEQIEEQTGICLYGYVPRLEGCSIESRHLGLVTPDEITDLQQTLMRLSGELEQCLDLDGVIALAHEASDYEEKEAQMPGAVVALKRELCAENKEDSLRCEDTQNGGSKTSVEIDGGLGQERMHPSARVRLAVAQDEAFCFYYQDNLDLLSELGAEIVPFSPIHDTCLPEGISGLLLGGGYPELYAKQLAANTALKEQIARAIQSSMPYLAECGGFMYLHEEMEDMDGHAYPMCGVIPGKSYRTQKLGRFGYITLECAAGCGQLLATGEQIRGHEFHYFDSTNPGGAYTAKKPTGKRQWDCIHGSEHSAAGYPHLYYWSNPQFAASFVQQMKEYSDCRKNAVVRAE
jgi:cobyrinic acid a,c-diamide synthase